MTEKENRSGRTANVRRQAEGIAGENGRFTGVLALVADDNVINRKILVEMLRQMGIGADTAKNGREAVEMARAQDYDILFMDIQMPELDGIMAAREIRKMDGAGVDCLPILAMTADAMTGDREKSLAAGMNDHLTKPVDRDALGAALRQWLPLEKFATAAAAEPETVIKSDVITFRPMPGLDTEGGMKRLGGNRELYLRLLADFIAGYGDAPAQLLRELRANLRDEAVRRVHAIRGVAGNLGGKELEAAAARLEKACRAAGTCRPVEQGDPLQEFIDRHAGLIIAIGAVIAAHPAVLPAKQEGPPQDAAELRPLLKSLKKALESEEPRPCKEILVALLQRKWPENQETVLAQLNRLVQRYRLAEALVLLDNEFKDILHNGDTLPQGVPIIPS
jgi:two-component system sensor histidine kinase/response regulator